MTGIDGSGTARARCVLAPNPGPMTLDGTNTWILAEPNAEVVAVVDPGPAGADDHLRRVLDQVVARGARVGVVLLTHGHRDHSGAARAFAGLAGAPVRALDPAHRFGDEGLGDGEVVTVAGLEIRIVTTPGHSGDSLCLLLPADRALLTGDTVLGRGTTVIAPDGDLADYLRSLDRLRRLADSVELAALLPGHGPVLADPVGALDGYLAHRRERLAEVVRAYEGGERTPEGIVARVYADVDRALWPAALMSVRAQLRYLRETGDLPAG